MLKQEMLNALNQQVNEELFSAYLYFSMAAYFEAKGLAGFSQWMKAQAQEEVAHAMRIYNYINERGERVIMKAIKEPANEWAGPQKIFEESLAHEQFITGCINKLVDLSIELKDHATNAMLQWFVNEQVEEEASVSAVLDKLNIAGDKGNALFMIDKELGQRVYVNESQTEE